MVQTRSDVIAHLIRLRKARGMTQEALAAASGIAQSQVSLIESGLRNPKLDTVLALLRGLQASIAVLPNNAPSAGLTSLDAASPEDDDSFPVADGQDQLVGCESFVASRISSDPIKAENSTVLSGDGKKSGTVSSVTEPYLTVEEAARELGIKSASAIRKWARLSQLEGVRNGNRILISRASVLSFRNDALVVKQRSDEADLRADVAAFDFSEAPLSATIWGAGNYPWGERSSPEAIEKR